MKPELVITEYQISGICAVSLMKAIKSAGVKSQFIILAVSWSVASMGEFIQNGGFDYLRKPLEIKEAKTVLTRFCKCWLEKNV